MKLLVVIVNYRVGQLVVDCLQSVAAEITSVPDTQVVVCENGSGGNSADIIQAAINDNSWQSWCSLVISERNLGFTGGNNLLIGPALKSADPPQYVLLLNPDTIVRPGAFAALLDFMDKNPKVGIAGSRLEDPDGMPQRSAFRFQSPLGEFEGNLKLGLVSRLLASWIVAPPVVDHPCETDWVSGASMMVRREVFDTIGLLDEGFFTYFDDIDFCLNSKRSGWPTWYVPDSHVVHLVGQSTGVNATPRRHPSYMLDARRRYFVKNYSPLYAALVDAGMLAGIVLASLRGLLTGKTVNKTPHLLSDSFRHSVFVKGFQKTDVIAPGNRKP